MEGWEIAAIVIGIVLVLVLLGFLFWWRPKRVVYVEHVDKQQIRDEINEINGEIDREKYKLMHRTKKDNDYDRLKQDMNVLESKRDKLFSKLHNN